jgi:hypothetical protein
MAENKPDKIASLRAKYRDVIRRAQEKLAMLDEMEADFKSLPEPESPQLGHIPSRSTSSKYSGWKITRALMDAIQNIGTNGGVTAAELRKHLVDNGYKHEGKYFNQTARLTLRRLVKGEKIDSTTVGDRVVYMAKKTD